MSIVEKLGIPKTPWIIDHKYSVYCDDDTGQRVANCGGKYLLFTGKQKKANAHLIATPPEMLEAHYNIKCICEGVSIGNLTPDMAIKMIEGISQYRCESATNKSWAEIKELL